MELVIQKILIDKCKNINTRTWMTSDEDVILDFISIEGILDHENIEDIIDRMVCHGNSMDLAYDMKPMEIKYRIKLIDMNNRKVSIEL